MKSDLKLRLWFVMFLCLSAPLSAFGQAPIPIVPSKPAELITLLPTAPAEWKMTESSAKSFFIGWICSQASREFQHAAPSNPLSGATPAPPFITRVRLMDTGYFPSFNGDFENFRIGKYSNAESLLINGMPTRRITVSAARERLRVSLRGRFIVEVETDNQKPNSGQAWLSYFDLRKINGIPDSGSPQLPKPIVIETVDELHPANNSASQLNWGGPINRD